MRAEAESAGRGNDDRAGVGEDIEYAFVERHLVDLSGGRGDEEAHSGSRFPALEHLCCGAQVGNSAAGAGADVDLSELGALHLGDGVDIINVVRAGDLRDKRRRIVHVVALVDGVRVGIEHRVVLELAVRLDVFEGLFVGRDVAGLRAHLNGHVGDGHALVH